MPQDVLKNVPSKLIRCRPGDAVIVRSPGIAGWLIRFGAALGGNPPHTNHVAFVHHVKNGVVWGIEGRPSGVGWVEMARYFTGPLAKYTMTNWRQPKSTKERDKVCRLLEGALGAEYDWVSIAEDVLQDLADRREFPKLMDHWWRDAQGTEAHYVCSTLGAYAYNHADLPGPNYTVEKNIQPYDWERFIEEGGYDAD